MSATAAPAADLGEGAGFLAPRAQLIIGLF